MGRGLDLGDLSGRGRQGRRTWMYEWIECIGIEADIREGFAMELDSGVDKETLANHPTKGNSSETVSRIVRDRPSADVYVTILCPGCCIETATHTTVTSSKPNFAHVGHPWAIVSFFIGLLVMVIVVVAVAVIVGVSLI